MIYDKDIHKLCTILLPRGKYIHWGLPMEISISLGVFQEKTSTLFHNMVHVCVYMDDLVIIRNDTYKNHMYILDDVLN